MIGAPGHIAGLALLGGLVAIDGTSFGQFMISRSLVAATLAGLLMGSPASGAAVGLVLEAMHLGILPVGAARYPESGPAAVVAGAAYATAPQLPSTLLLIVVFALLGEWISGETVRFMRQMNVRLLSAPAPASVAALERRHLSAVGVDFLRGAMLVLAGVLLLGALLEVLPGLWGLGSRVPRLVVAGALVGMLANTLRLFSGRRSWFIAGVLVGILFLLVRR